MAIELGKAFVQIVPSAQGISGSIEGALGGEVDKAAPKIGTRLAGGIKKLLITGGIGVALKKSLEAGGALEQSYGGLKTIYGDAANAAKKYANEAYKAGISTNAYAEQAVSFGAALKQAYGGDTAKAVETANTAIMDMADNAAKMGTPLQSLQDAYQGFAKQNYTMLDNLKLGYGGTKSEMERLLAGAEKLSGQKYDISNLGDVYDAIHVIQEDLGLTGVAADEASETFTGSLNAMKAASENFMANLMLGQDVGPAMTALAKTASTFFFDNLLPAIGNIITSLPTAIGAFLSTGLPEIAAQGQELIQGLIDGINTKIPELAQNLPAMLDNVLSNIQTNGPAVISKAGELVVNLGKAIITAAPKLAEAAATMIKSLVGFFSDNFPQIAERGGEIIGHLVQGIISNLPRIAVAVLRIGTFILSNLGTIAATMLKGGLSLVKGIATGITSGISSSVTGAMTKVKNAMTKPIDEAKSKIKEILDKVKGFFPLSIGKIFTDLKLPHISVSGGSAPFGIGGKGSLPKFSVNWYAKAMQTPYVFQEATLFGAGERGDEMLYGRQALMEDIQEATAGNGPVINNYITVDGSDSPEEFADRLVRRMQLDMRTA